MCFFGRFTIRATDERAAAVAACNKNEHLKRDAIRSSRPHWSGWRRGRSLPMQTFIPPYLTEALNLGDTLAAACDGSTRLRKGQPTEPVLLVGPDRKARSCSHVEAGQKPAIRKPGQAQSRRQAEEGALVWAPAAFVRRLVPFEMAPCAESRYVVPFGGGGRLALGKGRPSFCYPPRCPWAGLAGERAGALGFEGLRLLLLGLQESSTERRSPLVPSLQRRSCWALALAGRPA